MEPRSRGARRFAQVPTSEGISVSEGGRRCPWPAARVLLSSGAIEPAPQPAAFLGAGRRYNDWVLEERSHGTWQEQAATE